MKGNERKAECKKKKLCCKFEGLSVPARKNGITLIALIITIIVMLILVGVTINVALNGGLFTQAQTAASDTQKEAEKEQLLSAVVGAIGTDAKVDFSKLDNNLPNDWTGSNGTYTSPKGNTFTVDENGTITDGKGNGGETGGTEQPTEAWKDNGDGTYTKGEETVEIGQTLTNAEVLEKLGITESTETYTDTWTVIGIEGNKLKLISTEKVGTYTLGKEDPASIKANPSKDEFYRAAWSYAHMEDTLKAFTIEKTGINTARSIKLSDIFELAGENVTGDGTTYRYYCDDTTGGNIYCSTEKDDKGNWLAGEDTNNSSFTYIDNNKNVVTFGTLENGTIQNGEVVQTDTTFGYKSWSVSSHPNLTYLKNFSGATIATGFAVKVNKYACKYNYFFFSGSSSNVGVTYAVDDGFTSDGFTNVTEADVGAIIYI